MPLNPTGVFLIRNFLVIAPDGDPAQPRLGRITIADSLVKCRPETNADAERHRLTGTAGIY